MAASEPSESAQLLRFSVFELDCRARELRSDGSRIRLQEQPFLILRFLLERAGDVVTRDELRQRVWPSSVYVDFDHGLNNAIARLREALGDDAATPRFIETLPRLGYRFICPIEEAAAPRTTDNATTSAAEASPTAPISPTERMPWHQRAPAVISGGVALILVFGLLTALWLAQRPRDKESNPTPLKGTSIAVLPFANLSDAVDKRFVDGLSNELLHKLASIRGLKVVGPVSSFSVQDVPHAAIAETLKVNYFLDGSVRRSGTRMWIKAQLLDARTEMRLWSQVYERDFTDIFQVQDEIALAVAAALQVKLMKADEHRLNDRITRDTEAYRLYMIGLALLRGQGVYRDPNRAVQFFEEALARDPQFAAAQAGLALYHFEGAWAFPDAIEDSVQLGRTAAERAVALDADSSETLLARANFEAWRSRFLGEFQSYARAQKDYRRAIELEPTSSAVFFNYGRAVLWDEPGLAQSLFERTVELDPLWENARAFGATLLSRRGLHNAALKRLRELAAQSVYPSGGTYNIHIGIVERQLGHLDEATAYLCPGGDSIQCWSLYMALGDRATARHVLTEFRGYELADALSEAATLSMDARFEAAFAALDRCRADFPLSRILDLPAARFALITGHADRARVLLEVRLPDLARGVEPVKSRNVIPALDLAAAYQGTGDPAAAKQLLDRVAAFLDGPDAPRWPMFVYLRARTHALANEPEMALRTLERAYEDGFRTTWALDLYPQPLFYVDSIDTDPAFTALRANPRYQSWRERIRVDNAHQLENVRARAATPNFPRPESSCGDPPISVRQMNNANDTTIFSVLTCETEEE